MTTLDATLGLQVHLQNIRSTRQQLETARQILHRQRDAIDDLLAHTTRESTLLGYCATGFDQLLAALSAESLQAVESLLTYGLQTAFPQQHLACRLEVTTKRGSQHVEVRLLQASTGGVVDAPILDAFGGGPASVISFLLRLLVCRRTSLAPVILLDESFAFVSEEYIDGVAALLRELSDKLGLTLVLVTHQKAFLDVATVAYRVSKDGSGAAVFTKVTA